MGQPGDEWRSGSPRPSGALDSALRLILATHGVDVCGSPYGRQSRRGLFEFRLDEDRATLQHKWSGASAGPSPARSGERILLRVFCHATDDQVVLLLGGYDKGGDPSPHRQPREIARARARLDEFLSDTAGKELMSLTAIG